MFHPLTSQRQSRPSNLTAVVMAGSFFAYGAVGQTATGTIQDVQHVVILMLENRSFDHYFGALQGVRGFNDPDALLLTNGNSDFYQPQSNSYVLPFHITAQCLSDVEHGWDDGHDAWDNGRWDRWAPAKGTSAMAYYQRSDLPFYYALADAYTICDAYRSSVLGPTDPNRLYMMTGTIDPAGTHGGPAINNNFPPGGYTWTTYPERLQAAGITWRVYQQSNDYFNLNALAWFSQYQQATPGNPLYDRGMAMVSSLVAAFQSDVTNGTLPQVSWLIPPWSLSEHPPYSPSSGEVLTKQLLDSLASNPAIYNSTVFFLTYDENGGFFDHVPSPTPPPGTPNEFVFGLPIGLGPRVPLIAISPWSQGGYISSGVADHTSLIRFLETWTGVFEPNISSWRRKLCTDLTEAFDFTNPNTNYPSLPDVTPVYCGGGIVPPVPATQTVPTQESGTRSGRPLPYGPDVSSFTDCNAGRFYLILTNSGTASVHFSIYANAFRSDGPWQYDVPAGAILSNLFSTTVLGGGNYDLTCYGPNGFQRRFAGNVSSNCNNFDIVSTMDLSAGGIRLLMRNSTAAPVTVIVTNAYLTNGISSFTIPAGSTENDAFFAITNNAGAYDLTATVTSGPVFIRRFTGHLPPISLLQGNISGTNFALTYPGWAAGYRLETTTDPTSGAWTPVSMTPVTLSNVSTILLPLTNSAGYFRLSRQ